MFTGLIEELGSVRGRVRRGAFQQLEIAAERVLDGLQVGDSVNIDGVCQTAVAIGESGFAVETVAETLSRTTLGTLAIGQAVNLERPLRADQRLDGHLVLGHVDGIACIRQRTERDGEHRFEIEPPPALARYIAGKGSVALDGISLTVAEVCGDVFTIAVIPHTFDNTTLSHRRAGDSVNLEVDVIARYVERLLGEQSQLSFEDLRDMGY
ncbi:MAG: riboflavin synthase [Gemmatimonadetes bacterium]|nr:riboflavin synthase [Gemmatimonadota bacterium]MXY81801.1 riboflavin synthase [Gemmatimonadota bacterium]MYB68002.1 riboflavin synthase [Gemmatimonadota bacterium]